ncbi:MAG: hypothetical protein HGA38_05490 [Candidatus Moranbacteria bacterium]|nr:hypothetical protein [Candidatus Moranbacteria bacterium]
MMAAFAALCLIGGGASANAAEKDLTASIGVGYANGAYDPWLGFTSHDKSVVSGTVSVGYKGAYASGTYQVSPDNVKGDFGDERIYTLGYRHSLGPVVVDAFFSHEGYLPVDINKFNVVVDGPSVYGVTPYVGVGRWLSSDTLELSNVSVGIAGLKGVADIAGQPVNLSAHVAGYSADHAEDQTFSSAMFEASVPINVGYGFVFSPTYTHVFNLKASQYQVFKHNVFGVNLAANF